MRRIAEIKIQKISTFKEDGFQRLTITSESFRFTLKIGVPFFFNSSNVLTSEYEMCKTIFLENHNSVPSVSLSQTESSLLMF